MNIKYNILDVCRRNVFYDPMQCKISYNCLILKDFDSEIKEGDLFKLKHKTDSALVYDKSVSRLDGDKIFFGPSVDDISDIDNYQVEILDNTYDLSDIDNEILARSILVPNVASMILLYKHDLFRLISDNSNISDIINFESTFINVNKQYSFPNPTIEIGYGDNTDLQDFIDSHRDSNIFIQPVSNLKHKLDIKLWIDIDGGNPFDSDRGKKYKMVLTDLVYNTVTEKDILASHLESNLQKRRYSLKIIDQDNGPITTVNGLDFFEDDLILDFSKPQYPEQFEKPKEIVPSVPVLSQALKDI